MASYVPVRPTRRGWKSEFRSEDDSFSFGFHAIEFWVRETDLTLDVVANLFDSVSGGIAADKNWLNKLLSGEFICE